MKEGGQFTEWTEWTRIDANCNDGDNDDGNDE